MSWARSTTYPRAPRPVGASAANLNLRLAPRRLAGFLAASVASVAAYAPVLFFSEARLAKYESSKDIRAMLYTEINHTERVDSI